MARAHCQPFSPPQSAGGDGIGAVEFGNERGALVEVDGERRWVVVSARPTVPDRTRTPARYLPRSRGESWQASGRTRPESVLGTVAELGSGRVVRQATGHRPRRDHAWPTLCAVGDQRGLPGVCRPDPLEGIARGPPTALDTRVAGLVEGLARAGAAD